MWLQGAERGPQRAVCSERVAQRRPVPGLEAHGKGLEAPVDLEAFVFLNDAPAPRQFWARRQCHETTIHAVDMSGA